MLSLLPGDSWQGDVGRLPSQLEEGDMEKGFHSVELCRG